jgi:DNA-binding NarL/FixJ family response regulator
MQAAIALSGSAGRDISTVLIHQHAIVRAGLSALFDSHALFSRVRLIASPDTIDEALRLIEHTNPQLVLLVLPLAAPWTSVLTRVHQVCRTACVLFISTPLSCEVAYVAKKAGAAGCLSLESSPEELAQGIATAVAGQALPLPHDTTTGRPCACFRQAAAPRDVLTQRQLEVLILLCQGHNVKQTALDLGVSVKTVESHRSNMMERLEIYSVPGLVRYAIKHQLVPLE